MDCVISVNVVVMMVMFDDDSGSVGYKVEFGIVDLVGITRCIIIQSLSC